MQNKIERTVMDRENLKSVICVNKISSLSI